MGLADAVTAALILAGAALLLYRSIVRTKGGCHGCDGGGCRGRSAPERTDLVRLGGGAGNPPPGGGGRASGR